MANGSSELRLRELELIRHKLRNPGVEKAQIHSGSDHTITRAMAGWVLPTLLGAKDGMWANSQHQPQLTWIDCNSFSDGGMRSTGLMKDLVSRRKIMTRINFSRAKYYLQFIEDMQTLAGQQLAI